MKTYITCGVFLINSLLLSSTYANENALQTVKEMYAIAAKLEKGMEVIQLYADESLERAFRQEAEYEEGLCAYGHDLLWQSQDPEYNRKLTFTAITSNQVRVDLAKGQWHTPSSVTYKMSCQNGVCKVNDVFEAGNSLKAAIYEHCK